MREVKEGTQQTCLVRAVLRRSAVVCFWALGNVLNFFSLSGFMRKPNIKLCFKNKRPLSCEQQYLERLFTLRGLSGRPPALCHVLGTSCCHLLLASSLGLRFSGGTSSLLSFETFILLFDWSWTEGLGTYRGWQAGLSTWLHKLSVKLFNMHLN